MVQLRLTSDLVWERRPRPPSFPRPFRSSRLLAIRRSRFGKLGPDFVYRRLKALDHVGVLVGDVVLFGGVFVEIEEGQAGDRVALL